MIFEPPFDYDTNGYFVLDSDAVGLLNIQRLISEAFLLQRDDYAPLMNPHKGSAVFLNLLRDELIVSLVEKLVRGQVSGLQSQFYFCVPGTKGYAKHQDNFFVEAPYGCFVSVWIPLVDVNAENGGLTVYPGSHLLGRLLTRKLIPKDLTNQDPNAANEETVCIPVGYDPLDLTLKAGSAVFLHGNIVHSSHTNNSHCNRYAVLLTYIRKGAPFRKGQRAQREEVDLR